jgi:hypothetical protein
MPKGEKVLAQSKRTAPPPNFKNDFQLEISNWYPIELKQGEKISNLENASQNLIHLSLTICKRTLKRIYKRICKSKTCGASAVQNIKNKETIHAYLMSSYIGSILSNICTYIMQTSSIMHFYTCFGLCWHQSPKRGRLKGN